MTSAQVPYTRLQLVKTKYNACPRTAYTCGLTVVFITYRIGDIRLYLFC